MSIKNKFIVVLVGSLVSIGLSAATSLPDPLISGCHALYTHLPVHGAPELVASYCDPHTTSIEISKQAFMACSSYPNSMIERSCDSVLAVGIDAISIADVSIDGDQVRFKIIRDDAVGSRHFIQLMKEYTSSTFRLESAGCDYYPKPFPSTTEAEYFDDNYIVLLAIKNGTIECSMYDRHEDARHSCDHLARYVRSMLRLSLVDAISRGVMGGDVALHHPEPAAQVQVSGQASSSSSSHYRVHRAAAAQAGSPSPVERVAVSSVPMPMPAATPARAPFLASSRVAPLSDPASIPAPAKRLGTPGARYEVPSADRAFTRRIYDASAGIAPAPSSSAAQQPAAAARRPGQQAPNSCCVIL